MSDSIVCEEIIIYEGQDSLKFTFTCVECVANVLTAIDITGATVIIKYRNSAGSGSYAATIEDAANGVVSYTFTAGNGITPLGQWTMWPYVTFNDTRVAPGTPTAFIVKKEGT